VGPDLELLSRFLVHVGRTKYAEFINRRGQRNRPGHTGTRALGRVHNFLGGLVEQSVVVSFQSNPYLLTIDHHSSFLAYILVLLRFFLISILQSISLIDYSMISAMTPAPTVRPPSRIANRNSFSIAIGVINCTSKPTLSPGITISTPSGNVTTPVTSVVRK